MSGPKVLPRLELGDPILRSKSSRLTLAEIKDEKTQELIKQMFYTLKRTGGVGLAAPQIGVSKQLSVINIKPNKYHPNQKRPLRLVVINPKIIKSSNKTNKIYEGCLSFLDLFGEVERPSQIDVEFRNHKGELVRKRYSGLHARVFQHEIDHLNGLVWVDRKTDSKTFITHNEYLKLKSDKTSDKIES